MASLIKWRARAISCNGNMDITQDDIDAFHRTHYSEEVYAWLGTALAEQQQQQQQLITEHNDLGFYADNTVRTLTDEQIAIFRFSEEQTVESKGLYPQNALKESPVLISDRNKTQASSRRVGRRCQTRFRPSGNSRCND